MNTKPWSQLPNAHHIDWVLRSSKDRPELWSPAWNAAQAAAWDAAWDTAEDATLDTGRYATWHAAWDAASAIDSYWARSAARCAILALVAYDDCDEYLSMTHEQLHAWALLSETPQAVLLLSLKWVQENEHNTTVAEFA